MITSYQVSKKVGATFSFIESPFVVLHVTSACVLSKTGATSVSSNTITVTLRHKIHIFSSPVTFPCHVTKPIIVTLPVCVKYFSYIILFSVTFPCHVTKLIIVTLPVWVKYFSYIFWWVCLERKENRKYFFQALLVFNRYNT